MPSVNNWQIGREQFYKYEPSAPKKQIGWVFDTNKCIACQTCTVACKTTWTSGKGQEYMFWNNVETKPYGFYPLAWDVKTLELLSKTPSPFTGEGGGEGAWQIEIDKFLYADILRLIVVRKSEPA